MTEHLQLIARQLTHLNRMRDYLNYSAQRAQHILPITNWQTVSLEEHEIRAAFRVRFSEFQEYPGKTMRTIAIEADLVVERFGSVLAFMEKLNIIESAERWKLIRELRNAINLQHEEDADRLSQFFFETLKATPELFGYFQGLLKFCADAYGVKPE